MYGGVIAKVMAEVKTRYPAMVFPSSALSAMSSTYMMLGRFIDDEDAKAKNEEYQAVRNKAK